MRLLAGFHPLNRRQVIQSVRRFMAQGENMPKVDCPFCKKEVEIDGEKFPSLACDTELTGGRIVTGKQIGRAHV